MLALFCSGLAMLMAVIVGIATRPNLETRQHDVAMVVNSVFFERLAKFIGLLLLVYAPATLATLLSAVELLTAHMSKDRSRLRFGVVALVIAIVCVGASGYLMEFFKQTR